jgi:hypothetical protein
LPPRSFSLISSLFLAFPLDCTNSMSTSEVDAFTVHFAHLCRTLCLAYLYPCDSCPSLHPIV